MADLQPTLLDTTLLQNCIFLSFATSFLRFPSHVSFSVFFAYGLSRLKCSLCAHFCMFCGFFSFFRVSCFGFSCGLSSAFFLRFSRVFLQFSFTVFLRFFLRFFLFFFAVSLCFLCFFLRSLFAIASYEDENVNVIFNHKICAESKIFLLF